MMRVPLGYIALGMGTQDQKQMGDLGFTYIS